MSTSSTSSAEAKIASGRRSRTGAPVMVSTASATDSMCWTLQVVMTWMPASRISSTSCQRFSRGEPGALVWASSSMMRDGRLAGDDRVGVHLLDDDAAVRDPAPGQDLQPVEQLHGVRPAVRLDEADDDVGAALGPAVRLLEHLVRLADPGRHAQVHAQPAAAAAASRPRPGRASPRRSGGVEASRSVAHRARSFCQEPVEVEVDEQHVDPRLAEEAEERLLVWRAMTARTSASGVMPRAVATRVTWYSAAAGLMSGSRPEAEVVTRSTGIGRVAVRRPHLRRPGGDPVDEGAARGARGWTRPRVPS